MNLQAVKVGRFLHWPAAFEVDMNRFRGAAGYVVDLDAPLEAEWCSGQTHKLEPAPAGSKPNKINHGPALRALQLHLSPSAKAPAPKSAPARTGFDLPNVDIPKAPAKA